MEADSSTWTLLKGDTDGEPFLVRYRQFPPSFDRARHPTRLNIFWSMSEPDDNGLASQEEAARLEAFEDRLVSAVEPNLNSILVAVLTGKRMREFVFHTKDVAGFLQHLTDMPQELERYPIEIHRCNDEAWDYFGSVTETS